MEKHLIWMINGKKPLICKMFYYLTIILLFYILFAPNPRCSVYNITFLG